MARLDYLDTYAQSFYKRLYENPPTGYTVDQIVNADINPMQSAGGDFIKQSTVIVDRVNSSAGGLTARTSFLHTLSIYVDKKDTAKRISVFTTSKELIALFENQYFDGLYCQEATPENNGDEPNTNLYRYDVIISGYFEGN